MSSDTAAARRQQNSPSHSRNPSRTIGEPKSSHVTDPFLQPFLASSFDPVDYLNSALPPLKHTSQSASVSKSGQQAVSLAALSAEAQTLVNQLNTQTTLLSETLTTLTDEILRSGSRLAYQVELLRGETVGFSELLNETLRDDIEVFAPGDVAEPAQTSSANGRTRSRKTSLVTPPTPIKAAAPAETEAITRVGGPAQPEYITKLETLTLVRDRLDSVIKTFGDAMEFVFPPSEVSVSSSFLSVSAPDPSSAQQSSEEKGQQILRSLREEISGLLANKDDPVGGIEKAANRIGELKDLSEVWKGTAEEKGRAKFLESLARMVEERHAELVRESSAKKSSLELQRPGNSKEEPEAKSYAGGYGLISQLQRIRSGL